MTFESLTLPATRSANLRFIYFLPRSPIHHFPSPRKQVGVLASPGPDLSWETEVRYFKLFKKDKARARAMSEKILNELIKLWHVCARLCVCRVCARVVLPRCRSLESLCSVNDSPASPRPLSHFYTTRPHIFVSPNATSHRTGGTRRLE